MGDAVTVDAVEDNESLDDVNEGANDKDRENEKDAVVQETEANEVDADAEAGGMLRAAIDGLPVDLECVKDETEIYASEKQVESDSKSEQCEEKNITESAITSNQENENPNQETEAEPEVTIEKVVEEETVIEDGNELTNAESNDDDSGMANGEVDNKPSEASNMSSFVIEEVTISVKNMDSSDAEGENALGTYTLVDGNTGQKLVDEKDIGNDESIRTEYEIEDVIIDAEE